MKKCPKCGAETFYVTAHVTQDWMVDGNEEYLGTIDDCVEVTHHPDDMDFWCCTKCGYEDRGSVFNVKETKQNDNEGVV